MPTDDQPLTRNVSPRAMARAALEADRPDRPVRCSCTEDHDLAEAGEKAWQAIDAALAAMFEQVPVGHELVSTSYDATRGCLTSTWAPPGTFEHDTGGTLDIGVDASRDYYRPLSFDEVRRRGVPDWRDMADAQVERGLDRLLDAVHAAPDYLLDGVAEWETEPEWPTFDLVPSWARRLQTWATTGRPGLIAHHVVAHPLLVLWPAVGFRLHNATEPTLDENGDDW